MGLCRNNLGDISTSNEIKNYAHDTGEKTDTQKSKYLYNSVGKGREEQWDSEAMKNKRKHNQKSKVELPKRFRKNKK